MRVLLKEDMGREGVYVWGSAQLVSAFNAATQVRKMSEEELKPSTAEKKTRNTHKRYTAVPPFTTPPRVCLKGEGVGGKEKRDRDWQWRPRKERLTTFAEGGEIGGEYRNK